MKRILFFPVFLAVLLWVPTDSFAQRKKKDTLAEKIVPNIDLTHWKVTVPTPNASGKPIEVSPPKIFDYAHNELLEEFMYNDSTDSSIVFYAYPASSTANSKYSRSELWKQMVSSSKTTAIEQTETS